MSNIVHNYIEVYGIRKELRKFKDNVYGANLDGTKYFGDSYFSFNKIIPEPKDTTEFTKEGLTGLYDWHYKYWGTDVYAGEVKLLDEGDHLFYEFDTIDSAPLKIYFKIIERYTALSFSIGVVGPHNDWGYGLESEYGKCTKFTYNYVELLSNANNETGALFYEEDKLNNTRQLVREDVPYSTTVYPGYRDYFCSEDSLAGIDDSNYEDDDDLLLRELDDI